MGFRDHTRGSLPRSVASLAFPAMANHFLLVAFQVVDLAWVGQLGGGPLAAVSAATFLFWCLIALMETISIGTGALVGQAAGARDPRAVRHASVQGLLLGLLWSLVSAAALLALLGPLFRGMGLEAEVARDARRYAVVLFAGSPAVLGFLVLEAIFRARGDAGTPFRALALSVLLNAALDPILIFGLGPLPALGVVGAAVATVLTRGLAAAALLWKLYPELRGPRGAPRSSPRRFDPALVGRIVRIGAPIGLSGFFFSLVYVALARIVGLFGNDALGALGIGHKMESVSFFACIGFGAAAETLVAQNLGSGQPGRAERAAWTCVGMLSVLEAGFGAAFLLFAEPFARIFTNEPPVIALAASYLRIMAWSQPFMGVEIALERAFGGAGRTLPPMLVSIPITALRIPLSWLLAVPLGLGAPGIWIAISATAVARGIALGLWFRTGSWKSAAAAEPDRDGSLADPAIP